MTKEQLFEEFWNKTLTQLHEVAQGSMDLSRGEQLYLKGSAQYVFNEVIAPNLK